MSEISRLRWLCRRGMKELDVSLTAYLEKHYANSSEMEQQKFKELLNLQDPVLYELILRQTDSDERFGTIIQKIRHSLIS